MSTLRSLLKDTRLKTALRWGGTLIGSALFVWLLTQIDFVRVWELLRNVPPLIVIVCVLLFFIGQMFNALRWYSLLIAQEVPIRYADALKIVLVGAFASNFLPSTIGGDSVRLAAAFRHSSRKTVVIGSVVLDRLINMSAMFSMLPAAWIVFGAQALSLFQFKPAAGFSIVLPELFQKLIEKLRGAYRVWCLHPWMYLRAYLIAWVSILAVILSTWLFALALAMPVTFTQVMAVTVLNYFVTVLPLSFNGMGVREYLYTTLYTQLGATLEQAVTLALLTRLLMTSATLPGAVWISEMITPADNGG